MYRLLRERERERETLYLVDYIRGREGAHDFGRKWLSSDNSCLVVFYRHLREREREILYLVDYIRGREGAHDFGRAIHEGSC